jgi:ZIP family zinc transporter
MTWAGGLLALRLEKYRALMLAFAAGVLVASALMDVIPDALELLANSSDALHHHHLLLACCLGFLAFYLLEHLTHRHEEPHDLTSAYASRAGMLGATGVAIHSLLDGVAIGEAFQAGPGLGWAVALAVIVHKFADGVSVVGVLVGTGASARTANLLLIPTATAPLAGLTIQTLVPLPLYLLALTLGWFAGLPLPWRRGPDSRGARTERVTLAAGSHDEWRGAGLPREQEVDPCGYPCLVSCRSPH